MTFVYVFTHTCNITYFMPFFAASSGELNPQEIKKNINI